MDIKCTVDGQKLKILNQKPFPRNSQDFVRFLFDFTDDWDGLLVFAQFRQHGNYSNKYLQEVAVEDEDGVNIYQSVTLPSWPQPGLLSMLLYGTGGETVIGTTNHVLLHILPTGLIDDVVTSEISESLYEQLVNRVIGMENVLRLNAKYANTYPCVEDMQGDMELTEGMVARTVSYYRDNNLGGADYNISKAAEPGAIALANDLYANIRGDKVYPEQLGAWRDDSHDDTNAIQTAISTGKIVGFSRGRYVIESPIVINSGCSIIGDDMHDSILRVGGEIGLNIGTGYNYQTKEWDKVYINNIHLIGDNSNTCIYADDRVLVDGVLSGGFWGTTFNISHFLIDDFLCPFKVYSSYNNTFFDGIITNCGTSIFSYRNWQNYEDGQEDPNTYPNSKHCNNNEFRNVLFDVKSAYHDVPALELTFCMRFLFINCYFQNVGLALNSRGRARDTKLIACDFENVDYVYNLKESEHIYYWQLLGCKYVNVKGFRKSIANVQANSKPFEPILLPNNTSSTPVYSTIAEMVHNSPSEALYDAPQVENKFESKLIIDGQTLLGNGYFRPYNFKLNSADIRVPFNTRSVEEYETHSAIIDIAKIVDKTNLVACTFEIYVIAYKIGDPEAEDAEERKNRTYACRYHGIRSDVNFWVSDPVVFNNSALNYNGRLINTAVPFNNSIIMQGMPLYDGIIHDPYDESVEKRVIGHADRFRFAVFSSYVDENNNTPYPVSSIKIIVNYNISNVHTKLVR